MRETEGYARPEITTEYTPNGHKIKKITTKIIPTMDFVPGNPEETPIHEGAHGVLGKLNGRKVSISIIPDGTSKGRTYLDKYDPIAAAGSTAIGGIGDHDDRLQNIIRGYDEKEQIAKASEMLNKGNTLRKVASVGMALEEKGELNDKEITEAMDAVDKIDSIIAADESLLKVVIYNAKGDLVGEDSLRTNKPEIKTPIEMKAGQEITLPKASQELALAA